MNDKSGSVLIINDMTGYGRVSTMAMLPVLTAYGLHPYTLPTALVSNATEYGNAEFLDTTEYMRAACAAWKKNGFSFGAVATGLFLSKEQTEIVSELIDEQSPKIVFSDPIMADNGEIYDGMCEDIVECNRAMAKRADVLIPNFTEATMLTGMYEGRTALSEDEFERLADALISLGSKAVVISSCRLSGTGEVFNLVRDCGETRSHFLQYKEQPRPFVGTGDIFSAVIIAETLKGASLRSAAEAAAGFIEKVLSGHGADDDPRDLRIEEFLQYLPTPRPSSEAR